MDILSIIYLQMFAPYLVGTYALCVWAKRRDTLRRIARMYGHLPVYDWPALECADLELVLNEVIRHQRAVQSEEVRRYVMKNICHYNARQQDRLLSKYTKP